MSLLKIAQTRQISTPGGSKECPVSVSAKPPSWMLPNPLRGRHMAGWSRLHRTRGKSVIHLEINSQSPNGAAHRKKVDTPPLKGLRLEPLRLHLETCRATST
jgi:hypothetical protein